MRRADVGSYLRAAGDDNGTFLHGLSLDKWFTPGKQHLLALSVVGSRVDREVMFSREGLSHFFAKILSFSESEGLDGNGAIDVIRLFTKRIIAVRASALSGVEDKVAPVNGAKEALSSDFEEEVVEIEVPWLVEEVKGLVKAVAFRDLVADEGNDNDVLSQIARRLQTVEGVSDGTRVLLMRVVVQHLITLQSKVIEDEGVQSDNIRSHCSKSEERLRKKVQSRECGFGLKSAKFRRATEYLKFVDEFVRSYNESLGAISKIRPEIIDHAWCCNEEHSDALPETLRHTFIYLVYLKEMFKGWVSGQEANKNWKSRFESNYILNEDEGAILKTVLSAYFPNIGRSSGGMLGSMKRLLEKSRKKKGKDWLELLVERMGEDYEIYEGLSLQDLVDACEG